ncbi:FAD-binding domain-containing protein [Choiromyces venosus 120613-1]|uniref:FAD-binding domain-containing protein n=1 Tax=Choiromyces venosus 120613-1 TaxID=1336337 RepID=A0A3N4K6Z8_9PEZI|nr:FAD-binding domain-containing protein [Choiromyces venosus 120613-1]
MLTNTLCLLTSLLATLACASDVSGASNNSDTPDIPNITLADGVPVGSIIRTGLSPLLSESAEISLKSDGDSWRRNSRRYSHFQEPQLAAVVLVKNEDDILTTMRYAQENKRTLLVKGGGNGLAKMNHLKDVIMLDLSEMNKVTLNMKAWTVTVQPGARVEELIEEIASKKFRSPFPTGDCVGVIGSTLGGGHGVFDGEYGLMIDNLLSAKMITAKGEKIVVNATENPDLFWGIKGAGNNFGLITEATYRVYLKGTLFHLTLEAEYSMESLEQLFEAMNEPDMPLEASSTIYFLPDSFMIYGHIPQIKKTEFPTRYSRLNTDTGSLIPLLECNPEGWGYEYHKNQFSVSMKTIDPGVMALVYDEFSNFVRKHHAYYASIIKFESTIVRKMDQSASGGDATLLLTYDEEINDALATEFGQKIRELLHHNTGNKVPHVLPNYARGDEPLGALYGYDMERLDKLVALKRKYDPEQFFSAMTPIPLELPEDVLSQMEEKNDGNRLKTQEVLDGKRELKEEMVEGKGKVEEKVEKVPEALEIASENPPAAKMEKAPEAAEAKPEVLEITEEKPEEEKDSRERAETARQKLGPNEL